MRRRGVWLDRLGAISGSRRPAIANVGPMRVWAFPEQSECASPAVGAYRD
jgi:hypothetical protein